MTAEKLNRQDLQIRFKRGGIADLSAVVADLGLQGEPLYTTDDKVLYVHDGSVFVTVLERWLANQITDTSPNDDTSIKRLTLQKLSAPPTNAAYIAFSNNPGVDIFYLVLEEG